MKIILLLLAVSTAWALPKYKIKDEWLSCSHVRECIIVPVACDRVGLLSTKFINQYQKDFDIFMKKALGPKLKCGMSVEDLQNARKQLELFCHKGVCKMQPIMSTAPKKID